MAFKKKQLSPVSHGNGINEKLLHWVWQNQLLNSASITGCGTRIKILSPGILNPEDGPDFRNARIKFNDDIAEGDIEIHLLSSDWFTHKHQLDPKYNKVVLHVVWNNDSQNAITQAMKSVPTLNISKYVMKSLAELLREYKKALRTARAHGCPYVKNSHSAMAILKAEGINRFNDRKQKFMDLINLYGIEQATYIGVMESLGYVKNEAPYVKLANLAPIDKLRSLIADKPRNKRVKLIKTILLGVADLLSWEFRSQWNKIKAEFNVRIQNFEPLLQEKDWQFFKVRPSAFPNRRIEGISYFLADTAEDSIYNFFKENFSDLGKLERMLAQDCISKSCARTTILNVCLPILALYDGRDKFCLPKEGAFQIYHSYKRLPENSITKLMSEILLKNKKKLSNEIYYQGMIRIFHRYCKNKHCNSCPIKASL